MTCSSACGRGSRDAGDHAWRAARRCSLPGFDPEQWDPGAMPDVARDSEALVEELHSAAREQEVELEFDLDVHGCPVGWWLCRYADSVHSFMGRRDASSPVRSPSLRLMRRMLRDEQEPRELLEAVEFAEAHEDQCFARFHQVLSQQSD